MNRVSSKVALVTGGASGLGAADARLLAAEGAKVVITDLQADFGRKVAASIPDALFLEHDVRDEAQWQDVVAKTIARFGRLDVLVNNAGLVRFGNVEDCDLDTFRLQMQVMVEGCFLGCKSAIPHMTKGGGGSIVNVASVAALKGISAIPAYSAAKAGIIALTRSVAMHCQEQGYAIRVNAIAPGAHDTPMTRQALDQLPQDNAGLDQVQAHGQGRPEDVAHLVLFLASEESRQITGTHIVIDNGETVG
ncbi:MAG: family NAD(P)-dependent oxidoreductase [Novosphingobium lindaniclasticum]|jgi:3(or 17)beta-hydroxysteroid dehydrogenase|uniref:SDR family oxidoreductase n=1 Tax=Novosphingobium lindaniclasticum TaxID=1329895 RepID=UPI0024090F39|nr:SDR family oxidoreductase [Novosphingobium lindaniclasticum]MDF2640682.1 family NAD(P)-dependent oxidoreductase [Novosphingobium lindaniclasticum]